MTFAEEVDKRLGARPSSTGGVLADLATQAKSSARVTLAHDRQVGGDHYRKYVIQPADYILQNGIPWAEGTAIKYITRWRDKGGLEDLRKAIHILELLIEHEEGQTNGDE